MFRLSVFNMFFLEAKGNIIVDVLLCCLYLSTVIKGLIFSPKALLVRMAPMQKYNKTPRAEEQDRGRRADNRVKGGIVEK